MSAATLTLVVCAAVVAAAVPAMFWLRREADRSWRIYCATRPIRDAYIRFRIVVRDAMTPALQRMAVAIAEMEPKFREIGEAMRKAGQR